MAARAEAIRQGDDETIFKEAQELFLQSVSEKERAQFECCTSAQDLLNRVEVFGTFGRRHKHWTRSLERIKRFNDVLQPYFDIFNIVQSSHPEFAAIAWGSFLLVLKLASNFTSFFDKLGEILERLCLVMPNYAEIATHIKDHISDKFRLSLRNLYVDLFDFFRAVARVFTQKDGRIRRTPVVISQLLWRPFDQRFNNFSKRLGFHNEMLQNELSILNVKSHKVILEERLLLTQRRKEANDFQAQCKEYFDLIKNLELEFSAVSPDIACERISRWLDPPSFMEELETSCSLREVGTTQWLHHDDVFKSWQNASPTSSDTDLYKRFLWIKGNPGAGKTVLAASVVQHLQREVQAIEQGRIVCFYFFSYVSAEKRAISNVYRSILAQVLHQCRHDTSIVDAFSFMQSSPVSGQKIASHEDLVRLLEMLPQRPKDIYIILDGIDESEDADGLITTMASIFGLSNVKITVFSRPNVHALRKASHLQSITITSASVEPDLKVYFSRHINELVDDRLLPANESHEKLVGHLLSGADGMFMWARLMISYLNSPALVPASRLKSIKTLNSPERIDEMYLRILRLLSTKLKAEQQLARQVFLWLSYQRTTINAAELQDAITPLTSNVRSSGSVVEKRSASDEFADFEHTVIMACGSLVELRNGSYQLIHQSALEFLRSWTLDRLDELSAQDIQVCQKFLATQLEAECEMASISLSYLLHRAPAQPLSSDMRRMADATLVREAFPFLKYASTNWNRHLGYVTTQLDEPFPLEYKPSICQFKKSLNIMSDFLSNRLVLMSWIESFYTFEELDQHQAAHETLFAWAKWYEEIGRENVPRNYRKLAAELYEFVEDLVEIHKLWGPTLHSTPHKIWVDVSGFTNSRFLIQTAAVSVNSMATRDIGNFGLSSKPLTTISADTDDGDLVGVLSIWPSKLFEKLWAQLGTNRPISFNQRSELSGWIARFETWDITGSEPKLVNDRRIPLDPDDVASQVESFLGRTKHSHPVEEGAPNRWALPFPTTISNDLSIIIILKRVYILDGTSIDPINPLRSVLIEPEKYSHRPTSHRANPTHPPSQISDSQSKFPQRKDLLSCSYKFQIHKSNRYILYEDSLRVNLPPSITPGMNCLKVFELHITPTIVSCTYIETFRGTSHQNFHTSLGLFSTCSFHPSLPLVLLFSKAFLDQSSVLLWSFKHPSKTSCSTLEYTIRDIEALHFSACGSQVVAKFSGQRRPQVISLAENTLYRSALHDTDSQLQNIHPQHPNHNTLSLRPDHSPTPFERTDFTSCQITQISASDTLSHRTANLPNPSPQQREVQLSRHTGSTPEIQPVLALPCWAGMDHVSVGLHVPRTRDEKIKIILNKTMRPYYSLDSPVDVNLPAMVLKDVRVLEGRGMREGKWVGGEVGDWRWGLEE